MYLTWHICVHTVVGWTWSKPHICCHRAGGRWPLSTP